MTVATSEAPRRTGSADTRVWDRFVRLFHWALIAGVVTCQFAGADRIDLHVIVGYAVGTLVVARIIWGFLGTPRARFSDFLYSPAAVAGYLRDLIRMRSKRYLGHSPAGGAMVVALIVTLVGVVVTGMAVYAGEEGAGPLAMLFAGADLATRGTLADVHETFVNLLWLLVLVHVAGVALASFAHRENLVKAMVTGRKRAARGD